MQRKPSRATTKLTLFTVNKDEWNIKEDTGIEVHEQCIVCTGRLIWHSRPHDPILGANKCRQKIGSGECVIILQLLLTNMMKSLLLRNWIMLLVILLTYLLWMTDVQTRVQAVQMIFFHIPGVEKRVLNIKRIHTASVSTLYSQFTTDTIWQKCI